MASLGALTDGQSLVVMSPEHAQIAASGGMTKQDVQEYLLEHAARSPEDLLSTGKWPSGQPQDGLAEGDRGNGLFHRGRSPDDILLVVAGGEAGGHSAFLPSWSRGRNSIYQTKAIGVCLDC